MNCETIERDFLKSQKSLKLKVTLFVISLVLLSYTLTIHTHNLAHSLASEALIFTIVFLGISLPFGYILFVRHYNFLFLRIIRVVHHLEIEKVNLTAELELAISNSKVAEKARDTFINSASHEFKTPMHAILNLTDSKFLLSAIEKGNFDSHCSLIKENVLRLNSYIQLLLVISKSKD